MLRGCFGSQVVERATADAMSVRLGSLGGPLQARLDGFKLRALRDRASLQRTNSSVQRHLYATEWWAIEAVDMAVSANTAVVVVASVLPMANDVASRAGLSPRVVMPVKVAHVVVAVQPAKFSLLGLAAVEVALDMLQAQAVSAPPTVMWLLAAGTILPDSVAYSGLWGLARAARAEALLPLRCLGQSLSEALSFATPNLEPEAVSQGGAPLVPRLASASHAMEHIALVARHSSHLVTGGTRGLGLLTSRWLAQHGARALVLSSTGGMVVEEPTRQGLQLHESDAAVLVQRSDAADAASIRQLVARLHGSVPPIAGVWYAAGVLADSVLPGQDSSRLARVHAPKVGGASMVHCAATPEALRACVLFSSVAALLGGAGQANYSAANMYLDALAPCRRARALVGVSMQWGAWAEVGMAVRGAAAARTAVMEAASGFGRISLAQGCSALHQAMLDRAQPCISMLPAQWHRVLDGVAAPPFLNGMAPTVEQCTAPMAPQRQSKAVVISLESVLEIVRRTAGAVVDTDAPLMEAGIDSLGAVELRNQLQRTVGDGVAVSSTLVFDHPTARQVARLLSDSGPSTADLLASRRHNAMLASSNVTIEAASLSAALPAGVSSAMALRQMSHCGRDLLCLIPYSRWDLEQAAHDLHGTLPEVASRVRHGAFLHDAELFHTSFFGISVAEAAAMDPQQRQLLELGYSVLHHAGLSRMMLLGTTVAVAVGQWKSEFGSVLMSTPAGRSVYASTGFECSVTCGRVSFSLGLHGPCATYDTACSSSLVANHSGMRALQHHECETTLNAGVNMLLSPSAMRANAIGGFTSIRGRCHTFDTRADGYARGEAVDGIACRLCAEASARDSMAMLGSAVRQDGRSASLTAPNGQAQQSVLAASFTDATLTANDTSVLEAHGTGTSLGDPIEAGAVHAFFGAQRSADSLAIGSLKANTGHTEPAAGLAGALKLRMLLCDAATSPNGQLHLLNPFVRQATGMAYMLPAQPSSLAGEESRGGVSSFGYAGTIAHALLALVHGATNHEHAIPGTGAAFVRRTFAWQNKPHPLVQSCTTSSGGDRFRSPTSGALHALVSNHCVQGHIIFPGAGYLEMARAAGMGAALHSVFFLQPLNVEAPGLVVECFVASGRFEARSGEGDESADLVVHCSGELIASHSGQRVDHAMLHLSVGVRTYDIATLYAHFDELGLQYGPGYRTLLQAWGASDAALGVLRARPRVSQNGTQVHPADLDDALCVCTLVGLNGTKEMRLPFAVDEARLQGAQGALWAVCRTF